MSPCSLPLSTNYYYIAKFWWNKSVFECFYKASFIHHGWKYPSHLCFPNKIWHLESYKSRWAKSQIFLSSPLIWGRNHSLSLTTCAFQTVYIMGPWAKLRKLHLFKLDWFYSFYSVDIYWAYTLCHDSLHVRNLQLSKGRNVDRELA